MSDKIKSSVLYGAIIGDISGSPYERNPIKTKDYKFIRHSGHFTDDTVMTIAVADALLSCHGFNESDVKKSVTEAMQRWGRKYPHAGYGHGFKGWLKADNPHPYKSFGNGAAMRVSAVALLAYISNHFDLVRNVARWTAEVTHNNPEAVKSVEAVASAINLAQHGVPKDEIKSYLESEFGYNLSRTLDEIRPTYEFEVAAEKSVPEAIIAFLESTDFEDAIRNAVSLGGDADTQAAIAGSIAEAFYGVPEELKIKACEKLPREMRAVLDEINLIAYHQDLCEEIKGNEDIDDAMRFLYETGSPEDFTRLFYSIGRQIQSDRCFIVPMEKTSSDNDEDNFKPLTVYDPEINHTFMTVFTNFYEFNKAVRQEGSQLKCTTTPMKNLLETCAQVNAEVQSGDAPAKMGLAINPFSEAVFGLSAEMIELVLDILTSTGDDSADADSTDEISTDDDSADEISTDDDSTDEISTDEFSAEKSQAYKNLVERAKNQYREYNPKVKPSDDDKQRTRDFADKFADKKSFWDALKSKGLTWTQTNKDTTTDMWARNALSKAIACGFDPNNAVALFAPTVNGVNVCEEINLYTYWQGFGYAKKTPHIKYLLVAQDWGNFIDSPASFKDTVAKMNAGEKIFYPFSLKSPVDKNLIELFKILERDITKPCEDVFFTNFCLGYRLGKAAGGMTKKLMMRDAELFRELCEILQPENILCLGRITSECVYEALTGENFAKAYGDAKSYNDFLDKRPQIVLQYGANSELTSNFFPLAHCGGMGTAMRSLDRQREDWLKISDEIPLDAPTEWWWKKNPAGVEDLAENTRFAIAVANSFNELDGQKSWNAFIAALSSCSKAGGYILVPVYSDAKTFQPDDFQFSFMERLDGEKVLEIFATRADIAGVRSVNSGKAKVLVVEMREFFKKFLDGDIPCKEMLLNICGKNMILTRETVETLLNR